MILELWSASPNLILILNLKDLCCQCLVYTDYDGDIELEMQHVSINLDAYGYR